jgi:heavy metal-associated domain protein
MENRFFTVNGMRCEHCKASVENAIKEIAGVETAEVDLANKTVKVSYDSNLVSPDKIKVAVDAIGRFELIL